MLCESMPKTDGFGGFMIKGQAKPCQANDPEKTSTCDVCMGFKLD